MAFVTPRAWATNDDITASRLNDISSSLTALWTQPFAYKTSTEPVTASTTLQNDDDLHVSVAASTVYEVTLVLFYDGDAAGDLKIGWTYPASTTGTFAAMALGSTAAASTDDYTAAFDIASTANIGAIATGTTTTAVVKGLIVVASTAGTLTLQWSQLASNGTATRLFKDSYLSLVRRA